MASPSGGGPSRGGRRFQAPDTQYPNLNQLLTMMRRWMKLAGLSGRQLHEGFVDDHFAPDKTPGRDQVYRILNGTRPAEVTWGFVEAVADVCSANDTETFAEMKALARPLWDAFQSEIGTEEPAGNSAAVIPLQARVISLQDQLIAERDRLRAAEAKSVALGQTYLRVIQYLHELLFNMSQAVEELLSKRDDLVARGLGHASTPVRSTAMDLHEVRQQESGARAQQDRAKRYMADAHALAAQARRKANEVGRKLDRLRSANAMHADARPGTEYRVRSAVSAPSAGSVAFGESLAGVTEFLNRGEEALDRARAMIDPDGGDQNRHGNVAREGVPVLSGSGPDNPGRAADLRAGPVGATDPGAPGQGLSGLVRDSPGQPAEAVPVGTATALGPEGVFIPQQRLSPDQQRKRFVGAARARLAEADRLWRDGKSMHAGKVWKHAGYTAEPLDAAICVQILMHEGRMHEAGALIGSAAQRTPDELPDLVDVLVAEAGFESGMWLLDVVGREHRPEYLPEVLAALREVGRWAWSHRVLSAAGWYRYPLGIPLVVQALHESGLVWDSRLVVTEVRRRTFPEQVQVRVALAEAGLHEDAALLQVAIEAPAGG